MNKEEQIGTLVGLDLILSPEHYKEINDLKEENKQLKSILTELEEYLNQHIQEWENEEDEYMKGVVAEDKDILQLIQELKEKHK